jgi:putative FmdB family regulatory protein
MPTYEYRCRNGHGFEEFFLKMSDAKSELPCPTCGERGLRHMSAGGGLLFKGSGFYITDYGKDGKKSQAPAKSSATKTERGASEGRSEGSSESKSDGKTESRTQGSGASDSSNSGSGKASAATPAPAKSDSGSSAKSASPKSGSE